MKSMFTRSESGHPLVTPVASPVSTIGRSGERYGLLTLLMCLTFMFGMRPAMAQGEPEYIIYQAEKLASVGDTYTEVEMFFHEMSNAATYVISATTAGIQITGGATGNVSGEEGSITFQVQKVGGGRLDAGTYEFSVEMTGDGCPSGAQAFKLMILGRPVLDPFTGTTPVCNIVNNVNATGTITAVGSSSIKYTWKAVLTTGSTDKVTFTASSNGEVDYTDALSIAQTVENRSDVAVVITYTATPIAYYTGDSEEVQVVGEDKTWAVTVQPTARLTSSATIAAVCSGGTVEYEATSNVTGATLSWSRVTVTGITETASTGTGDISESLTNTTSAPITVTYNYTVTANSCVNAETFPVTVIVNPTPTLSSTLSIGTFCSGTGISYTPSSNVEGTTFKWSRAAITGITESARTDVEGNITNDVLTNTTTAPITVTYAYTLTANGCSNTQDITAIVQPKLDLALSKTAETICSGGITDVEVTSGIVDGVNKVKWTAAASGGNITGFSDMAEADYAAGLKIAQTLTNIGTTTGTVTYTVTQTYGTCSTEAIYVVTVAPTLEITTVNEQLVCSEDATQTVTFTSNVTSPTVNYAWEFIYDPAELTVDPTGVTIADNGDGKKKVTGTGAFTLTKVTRADNATDAVSVNVTVTGTLEGTTCSATKDFTVTVKPKPKFKLGKK